MKILVLAHTHANSIFRVGSHHLKSELVDMGHEVLYVSTPVSIFHLFFFWRLETRSRLRECFRSLFNNGYRSEFVPMCVLPVSAPLLSAAPRILRALNYIFNLPRREQFDLVLIDQPALIDVVSFNHCKKVVYRPTDIYVADVARDIWMSRWEQITLKIASGVVATSTSVLSHMNELYGDAVPVSSIVIENGVRYRHFSTPAERPSDFPNRSGISVIYIGAVDERFATIDIIRAATEYQSVNFLIIGAGNRVRGLEESGCKNIFVLGPRSFDSIPGYLQAADVTILPMTNSLVNQGRSPMKFFEYLAAGKPIICKYTQDLAARRLSGVYFYKNQEELLHIIEIANQGKLESGDPSEAKKADWQHKTELVIDFCGDH